MKIVLIGFMGSGKSTVAKKLSEKLQFPIIEMDDLALQRTKASTMQELFAKGGEPLLRQIEIAIAQEYASHDNVIISTGAGVVMNKIIINELKRHEGKLFFLKAPFEMIAARLQGDTSRPLFTNIEEAKSLYHFREPLYQLHADHIVEVSEKTLEEITREIWHLIHSEKFLE